MGNEAELTAPFFIDTTELGDVLPLAGVEYVTGAESADQTGEPHAPAEPQPQNMQAATWCFAMEHVHGEHHIIERPAEYAFWRDYVPNLTPAWPGPLLRFTYSHPITLEPRSLPFDPRTGDGGPTGASLTRATSRRERIRAGSHWSTGRRTTTSWAIPWMSTTRKKPGISTER